MPIKKPYNAVDTLRTFALNVNRFSQVESIFITPDTFTFTASQFEDADYWYTQLGVNILPIHSASDFQPMDDETSYNKSLHDFTYKISEGKYRHKIKFNFSLDYHQILNDLSGQSVRIIYSDGLRLRAVQKTEGTIQGFTLSAINLEKMLFTMNNSIGDSDLFLELDDSDELNVYGYEKEVTWSPTQMDRLVLNIGLTYSTDTITLAIKYLNENVTGIQSNDITYTDDTWGEMTFSVFTPGDGIYITSLFRDSDGISRTPTYGCLYIQSTLYIGQKKYRYSFTVTTVNGFALLSSDSFALLSGDSFALLN